MWKKGSLLWLLKNMILDFRIQEVSKLWWAETCNWWISRFIPKSSTMRRQILWPILSIVRIAIIIIIINGRVRIEHWLPSEFLSRLLYFWLPSPKSWFSSTWYSAHLNCAILWVANIFYDIWWSMVYRCYIIIPNWLLSILPNGTNRMVE